MGKKKRIFWSFFFFRLMIKGSFFWKKKTLVSFIWGYPFRLSPQN